MKILSLIGVSPLPLPKRYPSTNMGFLHEKVLLETQEDPSGFKGYEALFLFLFLAKEEEDSGGDQADAGDGSERDDRAGLAGFLEEDVLRGVLGERTGVGVKGFAVGGSPSGEPGLDVGILPALGIDDLVLVSAAEDDFLLRFAQAGKGGLRGGIPTFGFALAAFVVKVLEVHVAGNEVVYRDDVGSLGDFAPFEGDAVEVDGAVIGTDADVGVLAGNGQGASGAEDAAGLLASRFLVIELAGGGVGAVLAIDVKEAIVAGAAVPLDGNRNQVAAAGRGHDAGGRIARTQLKIADARRRFCPCRWHR